MAWLLIVLLLLSTPAGAQRRARDKAAAAKAKAKPAEPTWPIESLTVEGNRHFSKEQILAVAGLKIGQAAGKKDFEQARDRLTATGAFESVGYRFAPGPEGKGYAASFQVTEVQAIYPVRFEGLAAPDRELIQWLKSRDPMFGDRIPATTVVLDRYAGWIQDYLAAHQHPEKVVARVQPIKGDELGIIFRPDKPIPKVAQVTFEGNQVIPSTILANAISDVAVGAPYSQEHFRELLDNSIRPLYDARGRIRVAFPQITAAKAAGVDGLAVKVTVNEGPSYDLGNVRIEGARGVKPEELLKAGNFQSGDLANFEEVAKGLDRIRKRLRKHGFMRNTVNLERSVDDAKKVVNLVVRVEEGPQFVFGKLTIEGLDINTEPAIRKLWGMQAGKPFDADYPDFFLERVREGGYLENLKKTRSKIDINEQSHTVDVTLYFG